MPRHIVIVGVGALGSHVALALRARPEGMLLIDFDRVEQKNTLSQMHTRMSLGQNKAKALQGAFQGMFGRPVEAVPHKLEASNADILLGPRVVCGRESTPAVIVDGTDNQEARDLIAQVAARKSVPCLHTSVSADGTFARVMWDPVFTPDPAAEGQATCENGEHLPFLMNVGAWTANEVQSFLSTGKQRSVFIGPEFINRIA